jgi:multiple inositol-polyphosphate phosphatase/2,3-bisphosphoglycerate 3-phosphatase
MKKVLPTLLLTIACYFTASAQNCGSGFLGTKTLYKAAAHKYTPPPAGYKAVFINHVGRHGARHLTKDVKSTLAYALLFEADSANALTEKGKKLKQMVIALKKIEKGNTKSISDEGKDELTSLGERMYANYPTVFSKPVHLKVAVTKEIRTKQSADAFLTGLDSKLTDTAVAVFYNDDTDLRFYDLAPAYKTFEGKVDDGAFKTALNKAAGLQKIDDAVTARFFTPDFLDKLTYDQKAKFVEDIFGFATVVYSLKAEITQAGYQAADVDFGSFFSCDELQKLGELDSADENLKKGPATDNNGIQVRVAAPLLVDFINSTDDYIKTGDYNARLRFAHAETIAPFAALLQIATADKASKTPAELNRNWQAANVIPLSANIMWVFYKKQDTRGYLVKVLLNEKEVHISGLPTRTYPYYKWSALRTFYLDKLNRLHVNKAGDMGVYLTGFTN